MKAWEPPRIMTTDEENYFTRPQIDTPTPDPLALLKRCRPWVELVKKEYMAAHTDDVDDNRDIADLDALLSDIEKMEEGK